MSELKGKKVKLSCILNDKAGTFIAGPGSELTIGSDVEESVARQLLAGGSAALLDPRGADE